MEINDDIYFSLILFQALEYGFKWIEDIDTIFDDCIKNALSEYHFTTLRKPHNERYFNFKRDCIRDLLGKFINKKLIYKINRGEYDITENGLLYLNELKDRVNGEDKIYYFNIIKNTKKQMDIMVEAVIKQIDKANEHPIRLKYFKNNKLIPEIFNEIKNYTYFYSIRNDKL